MSTKLTMALALLLFTACSRVGAGDAPVDPSGTARVRVDGSKIHQVIDNWAVTPRYWEEDKERDRYDSSVEPTIPRVSQALVDQVGINGVRLALLSGMENRTDHWTTFRGGTIGYSGWAKWRYEKHNDNPDPNVADASGFQFTGLDWQYETMVLPLKRALAARGETLFINLCYQDFNWNGAAQGSLSHARNPEEFAEFVLASFDHLRDTYGVTPDAFEMILEPENTAAWRGPTIGRALVAVSDRLRQHGFSPEIIAPSNTAMSNAITYFDQMMKVPGVSGRVGTFAYHRYWSESTAEVAAIWQRAQRWGLKTGMLEKVNAGIDQLVEDLTVGNVSSWQQWAVAGNIKNPDNGGYYLRVDARVPADPKVTMARHTDLLSQVFLFVRRGARRIEAESDNADKKPVAFINPAGGYVVVVRASTSGSPLQLTGLPAGTYGVRFVSNSRVRTDLAPLVVSSDGAVATRIPGPGAMTVYRMP